MTQKTNEPYREDDPSNVKVSDRPSEINYLDPYDDPTVSDPPRSKWPPLDQDWPTKPDNEPDNEPDNSDDPLSRLDPFDDNSMRDDPPLRPLVVGQRQPRDLPDETAMRREAIAEEATELGNQALAIWRKAIATIGVIDREAPDRHADTTSQMVFAIGEFKRTH